MATTLKEYPVIRAMAGVGNKLAPRLIAEIGDIRRFQSGKSMSLKFYKPENDTVYLYMLKKEAEVKASKVAEIAVINKYLRIFMQE